MSKHPFRKKDNSTSTSKDTDNVLSRFLALEQRVLLDAAAVETAGELAVDATPDEHPVDDSAESLAPLFDTDVVTAPVSSTGGAKEVLFVDAGVENYEDLLVDIGPDVEVHVLSGDDWARQIESVLARRDGDVSAVHLVSHGDSGQLSLGGAVITQDSLGNYSRAWSSIEQALTEEGDLLIYGCDVAEGENGEQFVEALSELTGADIAASSDLTGVESLGGDWDLEHQQGVVETGSLFNDSNNDFMGLLADGWVEDSEISSGTGGVAITETTDGKDWKFIGTPGSNQVAIYERNPSTGVWTLNATVTGNGSGNFGTEVAAAGNKLAVSAPDYNFGDGNDFGRAYVYTYNGSNWTSSVQTIGYRHATGSGRTGFNGGSSSISDSRGANGRFGHSLDLAYDGSGGYRLVVGNPYEDWWQYDNDDNDGDWGGSSRTRYERDDVGVAHVYSSSGHGNFGFTSQLESQTDNGTMDNHYFGSVSAVTFDHSNAGWWVAVGGEGLNQIRLFDDPIAAEISNGGQNQTITGWDGAGINSVSMDDDYLAVSRSADIQVYKLNSAGTSWSAKGSAFGGANAVVSVDDNRDGNANYANVLFSDAGGTFLAKLDNDVDSNEFMLTAQLNGRAETAVAIEHAPHTVWPLDAVTASSSIGDARSYHYNQDPTPVDDAVSGNEDDSSITVNVLGNDTDPDIYPFGDSLSIASVGSSAFGATVTFAGNNVTYNPTTSTYLQSLAVGQTAQDLILVTVSDGQGGTSTSTLTVTIEGRNDAPTVTGTTVLAPFRYQQAGSTYSYDLSDYFSDPDQGESLSLVPDAVSVPAGWTAVADGSLLKVTIPSGAAHDSTGTLSVRMEDPYGAFSGTRNFVIQVDNVNDAPYVQNPIVDQVALANYGFSYVMPEITFNDPDPAPFDDLTYTATLSGGGALPAWLEFDPATRVFSGTPASGDVGSITVRVTADDGVATAFDEFTLAIVDPSLNTVSQFTDGPANLADFGFSTAISQDGNWMVVGSPGHNSDRGTVFYYQWNGSGWTWQGSVAASDGAAGDKFGYSVDINNDGTRIVVGARGDDGGAGSAYTFTRSGTTFGSQGKLQANGRASNDYFGSSVALNESGSFVLIGASHMDTGGKADAGAAFFNAFTTSGTTSLNANILPDDPVAFDRFGSSVAFDQNILVVSSMQDDNPANVIGRWTFDGASGVTVNAEIGGISGTLDGSAQFFFESERGDVLQLENEDGKMLLDSAVDLGSSWTIASWFKDIPTTAGGWRTLTRGTADHQVIISAAGELGTYDNGGGGFIGSGWNISSLADPTGWHHIAAVGEGGTTTFYIDGVEVASAAFQSTSDVLSVGNFQGGNQRFADFIDDFNIHDRALSQSEIRNIAADGAVPDADLSDVGSLYLFSTDLGLSQVTKLYAPDSATGDLVGWSIDVDIFNEGGTRQSGVIVASSVFSDAAATDGGAVYVWRSSSLQSGALNNGGAGDGTWTLESTVTSFDTSAGDYFGNDVAVDVDEVNGGTRLVVGAPFEASNGAYSGAVYAYKYQNGLWLPEKFVDATPQGGSISNAAFFGNSVDVAGVRAVFGSRYRDSGGQINDGATYSVELLSQGNYNTRIGVKTVSKGEFVLPSSLSQDAFSVDTTSTSGDVTFDESGQIVYDPRSAFKNLAEGETATDSFVYYTEQGGITYANEVEITVYGTAESLQASNDQLQVKADAPADLDVLANDAGDAGLTIVSVDATGLQGSLQIDASGTFLRYDPQGLFDSLEAGETIPQNFSYTVRDSQGNETTAQVNLLVAGVDDVPVVENDYATVTAGETVQVDLLANDSDRDGADTFNVQVIDTFATSGNVEYNGDGMLTYTAGEAFDTLPVGETAIDHVVYVVRDHTGNEVSAVFEVTVEGTYEGEGSVATGAGNDVAVTSGTNAVSIQVGANDEAGTISQVGSANRGSVAVTAAGDLVYTPGSALSTLPAGSIYVDTFSYTVALEGGGFSTATVRVYVNGTYVAPVVEASTDDTVTTATTAYADQSTEDPVYQQTTLSGDSADAQDSGDVVDVADMALEGLLELSEEEPVEQEPSSEETGDTLAFNGKPGLTTAISREVESHQSDLSSLLRHLKSNVA